MGLFDSVYILDNFALKVTCGEGHPQNGELQTKDLDCGMCAYYISGSMIFGPEEEVIDKRPIYRFEDNALVITSRPRYLRPTIEATEIIVYGNCTDCDPVVYCGSANSFRGNVDTREPWFEYRLSINDGRVVDVRKIVAETREDLRKKMLESGLDVLPDSDRVAAKTIEQARNRRR